MELRTVTATRYVTPLVVAALVKSFALAPAHYVAALCLLGAGVALMAPKPVADNR